MTNKLLLPLLGILFFPLGQSFDVVATAYAPLDPAAVAGMCYSGDPRVTASGRRTEPGVTIAAPRNIPFGTWIHIQDLGWRRVDDRGGKIRGNRLDLCVQTQKEALRWGRRRVRVHIPTLI